MSIVHGDLKGHNILVDATQEVAKICDFGSSTIVCDCTHDTQEKEGSLWWDSPELYEDDDAYNRRTTASDIWALGCVAVELQTGKMPYDTNNLAWVTGYLFNGQLPAQLEWFHEYCPPIAKRLWEILNECWQREPDGRPAAGELLQWFRTLEAAPDTTIF
ncbi:hypothetical protein FRC12_020231 [Ceratobasidium sp. 428]|nr:hypothetical protein FRC12_020231 [Ceratobasidium sp. 428]